MKYKIQKYDSYESLQQLNDEEFIDCAYLSILIRLPDPLGKSHYLRRLREGESKASIAYSLRSSVEGQKANAKIEGIESAKANEKKRNSFFSNIFSGIRKWNQIENQIRALESNQFRSLAKIESKIDYLAKVFHVKENAELEVLDSDFKNINSSVANEKNNDIKLNFGVSDSAPKPNIAANKTISHENYFSQEVLSSRFENDEKKQYVSFEDNSKLIAFYLPQYHQVKENSEWWGEGFTEWTNVAKAQPNFEGHIQPHVPKDLGFYDLTNVEVMRKQSELALKYGVFGFCFYHYWFSGRRILETPVNNFIKSDIDMPFCLCWANENWTRTWSGDETSVLLAQEHKENDEEQFIYDLLPYLNDDRYIKVNGRPLILIYRIHQLPNPSESIKKWRAEANKHGIPGLHIAIVDFYDVTSPDEVGADALVEFPPHKFISSDNHPDVFPNFTNPNFNGGVVDYKKIIQQSMRRGKHDYVFYRGIVPSWDNTARRQNTPITILNSSPALYSKWLEYLRRYTRENDKLKMKNEFIFINAWNEWGEGCHLEPDIHWGKSYLEETLRTKWYMSQQ
jgi:Glycosyltransferase WbsX/Domain of unknown function (DUF4214)